jgi:hypothetical protein
VAKHFAGMVKPVVEFCMRNDVNIMQMPCPETMCGSGGLGRSPRGKAWYEQNGLRQTSEELARGQADYVAKLLAAGIDVLGVIGIDFSPACAVNYLNKGRSTGVGDRRWTRTRTPRHSHDVPRSGSPRRDPRQRAAAHSPRHQREEPEGEEGRLAAPCELSPMKRQARSRGASSTSTSNSSNGLSLRSRVFPHDIRAGPCSA